MKPNGPFTTSGSGIPYSCWCLHEW